MQKTITVGGKTFSGRHIADLMDASRETTELGGKFIRLQGVEYYCQYRHDDGDGYFAPHVEARTRANCIKVENRDQYWERWITL